MADLLLSRNPTRFGRVPALRNRRLVFDEKNSRCFKC